MATRFVFSTPVDAKEFDEKISLENHPEHRIQKGSGDSRVDALMIATNDENEALVLQQELSRLFGVVLVERNVTLDSESD